MAKEILPTNGISIDGKTLELDDDGDLAFEGTKMCLEGGNCGGGEDTGYLLHDQSLGDVTIPANKNALFVKPVSFDNLVIEDGATVVMIE
jgi:hypothetical protein